MKGTLYGVGVGPGDPELMTLRAVRIIRENQVFALPGKDPRNTIAYQIAVRAVPELSEKELVALRMPMVKNRQKLMEAHRKGAEQLKTLLDDGKNVVFLTLGDPSVYSTFSYIQDILAPEGYPVEVVSGVPSFCACAARLGLPLAEWDEEIHVIPAVHAEALSFDRPGSYVLMKSGGRMADVRKALVESGRSVQCVMNCGMETEKVYRSAEEIPDDAGYFSLIIVK